MIEYCSSLPVIFLELRCHGNKSLRLIVLFGFLVACSSAQRGPPRVDAKALACIYPDASYSGTEFAQAFRYRTFTPKSFSRLSGSRHGKILKNKLSL